MRALVIKVNIDALCSMLGIGTKVSDYFCIWTINISGNSVTTNEEILAVLAEAGLEPGVSVTHSTLPKSVFLRFHGLKTLLTLQ